MDDIRNENLALYRQALTASSDQDQRRVLLVLLRLLLLDETDYTSRPTETVQAFSADNEPVAAAHSPTTRP